MEAGRWQKIQHTFERALELDAGQRDAFLREACGNDAQLQREVEEILALDAEPDEFLDTPPLVPENLRDPEDITIRMIGQRVGRYEIRGLIAEGGMGVVFKAEQDSPRRTVALKLMSQSLPSSQDFRRFQYESHIMGRLRHPGICQIYEADIYQDGQHSLPFFAMEYIPHARTITDYASEKCIDIHQRLELFARVCDAVHYGHQKGVIHRDLKPGNILVDADGQPKVIDFGVAKCTDADLAMTTRPTEIGQLVGTVQYMSPEQCEADPHDLDTRSDVYSLGVVLYELLAGELPYYTSRTNPLQAARIVREAAPRPLSSINRKLRGDVEIIVMKTLEKDRDRRYQSAADLANDIRRYLNREPIAGRPPTSWTLAMRWATRHPVLITAVACLGIATLVTVGTFVSIWFLNHQPYQVVKSADGRNARLFTFSGAELGSFDSELEDAILLAELIKAPGIIRSKYLVLIGWGAPKDGVLRGQLCAYEYPNLNPAAAVWCRGIAEADLPSDVRERHHADKPFNPARAWIADIFPENQGSEVVVTYRWPFSQTAICIYDLKGNLLYQVWHDGTIGSCYWMSGAGLLIFAGLNSEVYLEDRGCLRANEPHPAVLFAVRPEAGFISHDYLGSEPGEHSRCVIWYRMLYPCNANDLLRALSLSAPWGTYDGGHFVRYDLQLIAEAGLSWIIDEFGNEIDGTRIEADGYKRNRADLPDPNEFTLGALLPVISSAGNLDQSPSTP